VGFNLIASENILTCAFLFSASWNYFLPVHNPVLFQLLSSMQSEQNKIFAQEIALLKNKEKKIWKHPDYFFFSLSAHARLFFAS